MSKKRKARIVYFGTPEFAVLPLLKLMEANYEIAAVVTVPDKPAGRGQSLKQSAVKEFAISKNIKVMQPENLKDENWLKELTSLEANLFIVVAFRMLPKVVWEMPEFGTFNLHASLLPQYRGAAPINWAIINGEKETGVTTFFINEEIDKGNIILNKKTEISPDETAETLHAKLNTLGADLLIETVAAIEENDFKLVAQDELEKSETLKAAPKLNKQNTRINLDKNAEYNFNLMRGLYPYPTLLAEIYDDEMGLTLIVKIYKGEAKSETHNKRPGTVETDNKTYLKIYLPNSAFYIDELQIAGKNRMTTKDLLNGFKFSANNWFAR